MDIIFQAADLATADFSNEVKRFYSIKTDRYRKYSRCPRSFLQTGTLLEMYLARTKQEVPSW